MTHDLASALGIIAVIDLETETDPAAIAMIDRPPKEPGKALLRIATASQLLARETEDGWVVDEITTSPGIHDDPGLDNEEDTLVALDATMRLLKSNNGRLITFNGARHDVPIIQRRAARHLRFDLKGILGPLPRHLDMMVAVTQPYRSNWPGLQGYAAGLGIPATYTLDPRQTKVGRKIAKGEVDVVITFLLLMYELAIRRGSALPVLQGWTALATFIEGKGAAGEHLKQYARHPLVATARALLKDGVIS